MGDPIVSPLGTELKTLNPISLSLFKNTEEFRSTDNVIPPTLLGPVYVIPPPANIFAISKRFRRSIDVLVLVNRS